MTIALGLTPARVLQAQIQALDLIQAQVRQVRILALDLIQVRQAQARVLARLVDMVLMGVAVQAHQGLHVLLAQVQVALVAQEVVVLEAVVREAVNTDNEKKD